MSAFKKSSLLLVVGGFFSAPSCIEAAYLSSRESSPGKENYHSRTSAYPLAHNKNSGASSSRSRSSSTSSRGSTRQGGVDVPGPSGAASSSQHSCAGAVPPPFVFAPGMNHGGQEEQNLNQQGGAAPLQPEELLHTIAPVVFAAGWNHTATDQSQQSGPLQNAQPIGQQYQQCQFFYCAVPLANYLQGHQPQPEHFFQHNFRQDDEFTVYVDPLVDILNKECGEDNSEKILDTIEQYLHHLTVINAEGCCAARMVNDHLSLLRRDGNEILRRLDTAKKELLFGGKEGRSSGRRSSSSDGATNDNSTGVGLGVLSANKISALYSLFLRTVLTSSAHFLFATGSAANLPTTTRFRFPEKAWLSLLRRIAEDSPRFDEILAEKITEKTFPTVWWQAHDSNVFLSDLLLDHVSHLQKSLLRKSADWGEGLSGEKSSRFYRENLFESRRIKTNGRVHENFDSVDKETLEVLDKITSLLSVVYRKGRNNFKLNHQSDFSSTIFQIAAKAAVHLKPGPLAFWRDGFQNDDAQFQQPDGVGNSKNREYRRCRGGRVCGEVPDRDRAVSESSSDEELPEDYDSDRDGLCSKAHLAFNMTNYMRHRLDKQRFIYQALSKALELMVRSLVGAPIVVAPEQDDYQHVDPQSRMNYRHLSTWNANYAIAVEIHRAFLKSTLLDSKTYAKPNKTHKVPSLVFFRYLSVFPDFFKIVKYIRLNLQKNLTFWRTNRNFVWVPLSSKAQWIKNVYYKTFAWTYKPRGRSSADVEDVENNLSPARSSDPATRRTNSFGTSRSTKFLHPKLNPLLVSALDFSEKRNGLQALNPEDFLHLLPTDSVLELQSAIHITAGKTAQISDYSEMAQNFNRFTTATMRSLYSGEKDWKLQELFTKEFLEKGLHWFNWFLEYKAGRNLNNLPSFVLPRKADQVSNPDPTRVAESSEITLRQREINGIAYHLMPEEKDAEFSSYIGAWGLFANKLTPDALQKDVRFQELLLKVSEKLVSAVEKNAKGKDNFAKDRNTHIPSFEEVVNRLPLAAQEKVGGFLGDVATEGLKSVPVTRRITRNELTGRYFVAVGIDAPAGGADANCLDQEKKQQWTLFFDLFLRAHTKLSEALKYRLARADPRLLEDHAYREQLQDESGGQKPALLVENNEANRRLFGPREGKEERRKRKISDAAKRKNLVLAGRTSANGASSSSTTTFSSPTTPPQELLPPNRQQESSLPESKARLWKELGDWRIPIDVPAENSETTGQPNCSDDNLTYVRMERRIQFLLDQLGNSPLFRLLEQSTIASSSVRQPVAKVFRPPLLPSGKEMEENQKFLTEELKPVRTIGEKLQKLREEWEVIGKVLEQAA